MLVLILLEGTVLSYYNPLRLLVCSLPVPTDLGEQGAPPQSQTSGPNAMVLLLTLWFCSSLSAPHSLVLLLTLWFCSSLSGSAPHSLVYSPDSEQFADSTVIRTLAVCRVYTFHLFLCCPLGYAVIITHRATARQTG